MKPKHQRLILISIAMVAGAVFVGLVLTKFQDNLVFFYTPADIAAKKPEPGKPVRLGGLVDTGSVVWEGDTLHFTVSDMVGTIAVTYRGEVPSLFREGQGVVMDGTLAEDGTFTASRVLAKHDEKYMPPEVEKALKKQGHWKDDYGKGEGE